MLINQTVPVPPSPSRPQPDWREHRWPLALTLLVWGGYLCSLLPRIFRLDDTGAWAGHINVWSDWPLHLAMTQFFAERDPAQWLSQHPMYSDAPLAYPFLTNLVSGLLHRAGLGLDAAMTAPSLLYALLLVLGLYALFSLLTGTPRRAATAVALFFLASGLGFLDFLADLASGSSLPAMLAFPPELYSRADEYQWYSGNFVVGMLMPQRAFLLGLTLAVWSQVLLLYALLRRPRRGLFIGAGLLAGLLPIAHAHSFLAVVLISGPLCLLLWQHWRDWLWYAVPAALLATLLLFGVLGVQDRAGAQLGWLPGFTAPHGLLSWLIMWTGLWGALLPLALAGLTQLRARPCPAALWLASGWWLFAFANLVRTQPIPWDNSKLFLWAYLGLAGLATLALARLWRSRDRWLGRGLAGLLGVLLTATGALELIRLQRIDRGQLQITSSDDIALGRQLRELSEPEDVFLTGTAHNHFVMAWAARPIVMGFRGWVGNFGLEQEQRWADMRRIYAGAPEAEALLARYGIDYVVVGPGERSEFTVNEAWLHRLPLVAANRSYRVYRVPEQLRPTPAAASPAG